MASLLDQLKALQKSRYMRAERATAQIAQLRGEKLVDIFLEAGDNTDLRRELFQTVSEVRAELENNIQRQDKDISDNKDELTNLITEKDAAVWAEFERRLKEGLIDKERFASSVTAGSQLMSQSMKEALEKLCTCQTENSNALVEKVAELITVINEKEFGGGGSGPSIGNSFSTPVILGTRKLKVGETGTWTISSTATGNISISGFDVSITNEDGGDMHSERLSAINDENKASATLTWTVPEGLEKSGVFTITARATGGNIVSKDGTFQISVALADEENPDIPLPPPELLDYISIPVILGTTTLDEGTEGSWTVTAYTQVEEAVINYFTVKIYNDSDALLSTQTVTPIQTAADYKGEDVSGAFKFTIPVGIPQSGTYRIEATATDTGLSYTSKVGTFTFTVNKKADIVYLATPTVEGELDGFAGQTLTLTASAQTLTEDAVVSSFRVQFNNQISTFAATNGKAEIQVAIPADAEQGSSLRLIVSAVDLVNSFESQPLLVYVNVSVLTGTDAWTTEEPDNINFLPGYTEQAFNCGEGDTTVGISPNVCPGSEMQLMASRTSNSGCQMNGKVFWQVTGFDLNEKPISITIPGDNSGTVFFDEIFTLPDAAKIGTKFKVCAAYTWETDGQKYKWTFINNTLCEVKECSAVNPSDEPSMPTIDQLAPGEDFAGPVITCLTNVTAGQEVKVSFSTNSDKTITAYECFFSNELIKRTLTAVANKSNVTITIPEDFVLGQMLRVSAVAVAGSERSEMSTKLMTTREMSYGDSTLVTKPVIEGPTKILAGQTPSWSVTSTGAVSFDVKIDNKPVKSVQAINGVSAISQFIPSATVVGTNVKIQAVAVDSEGGRSQITTFTATTVAEQIIPPTTGETPTNQTAGAITFKPGPFDILSVAGDTQEAARYRVLTESGEIVFDSGDITDPAKFNEYIVRVGVDPITFAGTGNYILQMAQKGTILGWSDYSEIIVYIEGLKQPTITYPTANAEVQRAGLTITGTAMQLAEGLTDTLDKARWQILNEDNTVAYDSGEVPGATSFTLTSEIVIANNIAMSKKYKFIIRYKGATYGWSKFSAPVQIAAFTYDFDPVEGNEQVFTGTSESHSFTVPAGVTTIGVLVVGGGSTGQVGSAGSISITGIGGNGGYPGGIISGILSVTPNTTLKLIIGARGNVGGSSTLGSYITATGGQIGAIGHIETANLVKEFLHSDPEKVMPFFTSYKNALYNRPHGSECIEGMVGSRGNPGVNNVNIGLSPEGCNGGKGGAGFYSSGNTNLWGGKGGNSAYNETYKYVGTGGEGGEGGASQHGGLDNVGRGTAQGGQGGVGWRGGQGGNAGFTTSANYTGSLGGNGGQGMGLIFGFGGAGGHGGNAQAANGGNGGGGGQGEAPGSWGGSGGAGGTATGAYKGGNGGNGSAAGNGLIYIIW